MKLQIICGHFVLIGYKNILNIFLDWFHGSLPNSGTSRDQS